MFLNEEVLRKYEACDEGIDFFNKHFPNGTELIDVVRYEKTPMVILHWGYTSLPTTDEEKAVYIQRCNIINSTHVSLSDRVENSEIVIKSHHVSDSKSIHRSKHITNCVGVIDSRIVSNSTYIEGCCSVKNSSVIISSRDVKNSSYIFESQHVYSSDNIYKSDMIEQSHFIMECSNSQNIYFCRGVTNSKNCMFCRDIDGGEFMIFNHKVSEDVFRSFEEELLELLNEGYKFNYFKSWDYESITEPSAVLHNNITFMYKNFPEDFWEWVAELPYYDTYELFMITLLTDLMRK